jgi:hypothetical protein
VSNRGCGQADSDLFPQLFVAGLVHCIQ